MKIFAAVAIGILLTGCRIFPPPEYFVQRIALRHPDNPHAQFVEGKSFLEQGQPKKAAVRFQNALRLQPNFLEARLGLAHAYRDMERFGPASELYRLVLEETPNNPQALEGLGVSAAKLGQPKEAEDLLNRALKIEPRSVSALNALAGLYYDRREYRRALEYWRKSLAIDPAQNDIRALVEDLRGYVAKYFPEKK